MRRVTTSYVSVMILVGSLLGAIPRQPVLAAGAHPNLSGTWAMEGTGPAGLVAVGGRIATLAIRQRAAHLTITLRSGSHTYHGGGTILGQHLRLGWSMPLPGAVRVDGTLLASNTRVLGQWSDAHGDDGGVLLVRVSH